jgi:hypothetical protein
MRWANQELAGFAIAVYQPSLSMPSRQLVQAAPNRGNQFDQKFPK